MKFIDELVQKMKFFITLIIIGFLTAVVLSTIFPYWETWLFIPLILIPIISTIIINNYFFRKNVSIYSFVKEKYWGKIKASEEFKESTQVSIDDDFDNSTGKKSNSLIPIIIGIVFIIVIYFIWDGSSGSSSISFNEAKIFMKNRCSNIGQTYIDGKSISVDNTRTYVFLTQGNRHPDFYCVTMITENKLEVLKTDCGRSEKKVLFNRL